MAELYHSKQNIPVTSAPQINPGVARMVTDTGLGDIGKALTQLGNDLHQINVARQTARAVAAYNTKMAEFKLRMQTADPSKVNYDEEWNKFVAQQKSLSKGVSRDAAEAIDLKLTEYNAHNYADIKKMELQNTRDMVMAEAPDVMEQSIMQQVKAEFNKDPMRAKQAERNYQQWLEGVSPALKPDERKKFQMAYKTALDEGRAEEEKQRVHMAIMADPEKALEIIPQTKYMTPEDQLSLMKSAKATISHKQQMSDLQLDQLENQQAGGVLDEYLNSGSVPVQQNATEDVQTQIDALNDKVASKTADMGGEQLHPIYYRYQDRLEKLDTLSQKELLEAATVLPRNKVQELRDASKLNETLLPKQAEVKDTVKQINTGMGQLMDAAANLDDPETAKVMLQELEEERNLLINESKQRYAKGDNRVDINSDLNSVFQAKTEGVLDAGYRLPFRRGTNRFTKQLEENASERERRHALINLLMAGDFEREIEAAVDAGWFNE